MTGTRSGNEVLLTAEGTENDGSLVFKIPAQAGPVYLDGIHLLEAETSPLRPDSVVRFVYNASKGATTLKLDGVYLDAKGKTYFGKITLEPYSSVVLVRKS